MPGMKRVGRVMAGSVLTLGLPSALLPPAFPPPGKPPAALMIPPPSGGPGSLPEGVRVLRWSPGFAMVTSDSSDYVRRLYGKGTLLVLPVRKSGCLALRGGMPGIR